MGDAKQNDSQLPNLPVWLWVILAPFIFLSIPFIMMGGSLLAVIARAFGASEKAQQNAFIVAGVIFVPIFILLIVSSVFSSSTRSAQSYSPVASSYYVGRKPAREPIGSDVAVRGHVRSDGTYVAPHFRTQANHTTGDNYSTYPNINPYTGERGAGRSTFQASSLNHSSINRPAMQSFSTPFTSPHFTTTQTVPEEALASPQSSVSSFDQRQREQKSESLHRLGHDFSPDDYTWSQLYDFEQRITKTKAIAELGVNLDWKEYTWSELYDIENRIRKSIRLADLGYTCKWQDHSWSEMFDIEGRIRKADELQRLGYSIDWREYDYLTLSDLCREARKLDAHRE